MKRFLKILMTGEGYLTHKFGYLIHKLARGLGYLIIVAAIPIFFIIQMIIDDAKATARNFEKFETFAEGLDGHSDYIPINGLKIPLGCFEYIEDGGDNYEIYYESYAGNEANYNDADFISFIENIGDSMGSIVPINDALSAPFGLDGLVIHSNPDATMNLSPRIDQCPWWGGDLHRLVMTPKNLCKEYAPHLDKTCLGTVLGIHYDHRGMKRISRAIGVYGIYQGYEEVEVVVPLRMYIFYEAGDRAAQFLVDAGWDFNPNEN